MSKLFLNNIIFDFHQWYSQWDVLSVAFLGDTEVYEEL